MTSKRNSEHQVLIKLGRFEKTELKHFENLALHHIPRFNKKQIPFTLEFINANTS